MTDEELEQLLEAQQQLEEQLSEFGPQNDEELHEWLKFELGIDIPKVKVCEAHDAPFTFLADLYFERVEAALGVANRGGAKTFLVAVLHWLNSRFKPGCESCTFGAIEAQSFRAYAHLRNWIYDEDGNLKPTIVSSLMRDTTFKNGSKIEVLGSTPDAVNGPHPQKAHADEIELMRDDTFRESRNMTVSKTTQGRPRLHPAGHPDFHQKGSERSSPAAHRRDRGGRGSRVQAASQALHVVHQGDQRPGQELPGRTPRSSQGFPVPVRHASSEASGRMDHLARSIRSAAATSTRAVAGSPSATSRSSSARTTARPSRRRCSAQARDALALRPELARRQASHPWLQPDPPTARSSWRWTGAARTRTPSPGISFSRTRSRSRPGSSLKRASATPRASRRARSSASTRSTSPRSATRSSARWSRRSRRSTADLRPAWRSTSATQIPRARRPGWTGRPWA
jgi:hypothetical protein